MLRRVLAVIAAVLAGALLGAASAWAVIGCGASSSVERFGGWAHNRAAGSEAAGHYSRAIIAKEGLLALSAREALYFTLTEDSEGRPLSESCIYELEGRPLDARWCSVTLYARDDFLVRNSDSASSVDASSVSALSNGAWRIRIAPVRGDAPNWISSRDARRDFSLMLRVYNPQRDFRAAEETLPVLTTLSCSEGGA